VELVQGRTLSFRYQSGGYVLLLADPLLPGGHSAPGRFAAISMIARYPRATSSRGCEDAHVPPGKGIYRDDYGVPLNEEFLTSSVRRKELRESEPRSKAGGERDGSA
jgi:hypothetical protein